MASISAELRPISWDDVARVSDFLHSELNHRVSPAAWSRLFKGPWRQVEDNYGFMLLHNDAIVGAYVAVYSMRASEDGPVKVCNLAAFCVLEPFRSQGLRLARAILAQKGYNFTDLSPSGAVPRINERLGFRYLDTTTKLVLNLPFGHCGGIRVTSDSDEIRQELQGNDAQLFADHCDSPATRHILVTEAGTYAYLVFRRDRRKGLPLFASPLYAGGATGLLSRSWPMVRSELLLRHRLPATLAERRILGFTPSLGIELQDSRPKMLRSLDIDEASVDYLYSELAIVEW